ncbi:hypothetical protein [Rhizobacter sp. Root1221]|uniref:hypothetical protein n=1 Tax=Rhizobacter sp. Root1221 TaxID=1736433 RepID=UPI0006F387DF|nr:hypothetical protein [Rhizobacter sp. Root1221]KQW01348.1 hypothetical protein ASC87_15840 [Rhizobacter sp. Root1221]
MKSIIRMWLLCASSVVVLCGCGGGGGDDTVATDESGLPPASSCLPTTEALGNRVQGMNTYAEVAAHMGCEGRLVGDVTTSGHTVRTYDWGRVESGPYVQMEFRTDQLHGWTSKGLYGADPATCLPTRAAVDRLAVDMDILDVNAIIGCRGQTVSFTVNYASADGLQSVEAWGNVTSGPYLMATFKKNLLVAFSTQRL